MENIIKKSEAGNTDKSDWKFAQSFAKLSAILQDFCLFYAEKNERNYSRFVAFAKFSPSQDRFLSPKLNLWFPEIWELFPTSILCKTSPRKMTVKF